MLNMKHNIVKITTGNNRAYVAIGVGRRGLIFSITGASNFQREREREKGTFNIPQIHI